MAPDSFSPVVNVTNGIIINVPASVSIFASNFKITIEANQGYELNSAGVVISDFHKTAKLNKIEKDGSWYDVYIDIDTTWDVTVNLTLTKNEIEFSEGEIKFIYGRGVPEPQIIMMADKKKCVLKCAGKKAISDIRIRPTFNSAIKYNNKTTLINNSQTATLSCAEKKMITDVIISEKAPRDEKFLGTWQFNTTQDVVCIAYLYNTLWDGYKGDPISFISNGCYFNALFIQKSGVLAPSAPDLTPQYPYLAPEVIEFGDPSSIQDSESGLSSEKEEELNMAMEGLSEQEKHQATYVFYFFTQYAPTTATFKNSENVELIAIKQYINGKWTNNNFYFNNDNNIVVTDIVSAPMAFLYDNPNTVEAYGRSGWNNDYTTITITDTSNLNGVDRYNLIAWLEANAIKL